jgi:hypothetical protein
LFHAETLTSKKRGKKRITSKSVIIKTPTFKIIKKTLKKTLNQTIAKVIVKT